MKKLLIILLILLVFSSSCSIVDKMRQPFMKAELAEPDQAEEFFWSEDREPVTVAPMAEPSRAEGFFWTKEREPIATTPARTAPRIAEQRPFSVRPELVAVNASGASAISKS